MGWSAPTPALTGPPLWARLTVLSAMSLFPERAALGGAAPARDRFGPFWLIRASHPDLVRPRLGRLGGHFGAVGRAERGAARGCGPGRCPGRGGGPPRRCDRAGPTSARLPARAAPSRGAATRAPPARVGDRPTGRRIEGRPD